ncbi:porin [Yoonia sp.]|uniref:porin n=1 Tax=Yoonia sp. TaxID=2212373 RepID=UPI003A4DF812
MKSILLTTTALVAFAGAAVAEVSFSGEATLGYNNDVEDGFYWDAELGVLMSQELDNGVTAGAEFTIDFSDNNLGEDLRSAGYVLSLTSENAGLFFGDVGFAAEKHWVAAGAMFADGFSEADGETAIRGDVMFGGVDASISYVLSNNEETDTVENDLDQLSLGMSADLGQFTIAAAYQAASDEAPGFYSSDHGAAVDPTGSNGDFSQNEIFGISAATTVAGATVRLAYADNSVRDSIGIAASYPVGPVTLSAYYVIESLDEDGFGLKAVYADGPISVTANYEERVNALGVAEWRYNFDGAYDIGNGLVVKAGYADRETYANEVFYVAGEYDLGSGAMLLVSYADDDANATGDEVGAPEYQIGTTVEVSFKF